MVRSVIIRVARGRGGSEGFFACHELRYGKKRSRLTGKSGLEVLYWSRESCTINASILVANSRSAASLSRAIDPRAKLVLHRPLPSVGGGGAAWGAGARGPRGAWCDGR